jgi:hypothetical protein
LIERFIAEGRNIVFATEDDDESATLAGLGAVLEPVTFNRGGFSPLADWRAGRRLRQVLRRWRPSLVHFFHAKPVIMGYLGARKMWIQVDSVHGVWSACYRFAGWGEFRDCLRWDYRLLGSEFRTVAPSIEKVNW